MTAKLLDGRACAERIKKQIAHAVEKRRQQGLSQPALAVILVGDDPASASYVGHKQKACEAVGIHSILHRLPTHTTQAQLLALINDCNADPKIHGILLQLPLPSHIRSEDLLECILPEKDVDGFHPYNLGHLAQGRSTLTPCTPQGIMTLLQETHENLAGKHAVVVGASNIVGRPMALTLLTAKCTVTICHRLTEHLDAYVRSADLLVVAIGKPGVIQTDWIKPGATVIDVGFNRLTDGTIVGDIDFISAKEKAAWITPVPGGVGPMTVATLLENTVKAALLQD